MVRVKLFFTRTYQPLSSSLRVGGGGPEVPLDGRPDVSELDPDRSSAPAGVHGILQLLGIAFLGFVANFIGRAGQNLRAQSTLGTVALYWHFVGGLWICLFGLLLIAIQ